MGVITSNDLISILGLDAYSTIRYVKYINENLYLAIFSDSEGSGYFTLTDIDGNFKFEPIKYTENTVEFDYQFGMGSIICATESNIVVLDTAEVIEENYQTGKIIYNVKSFDINGTLIGTTEYVRDFGEYEALYPREFLFSANEEAIIIGDYYFVTYYDFELNKLCGN